MTSKMPWLNQFISSVFGPRLYRIYRREHTQRHYEPTSFERWGDQVIKSISVLWSIGLYTSPFIALFVYRRYNTMNEGIFAITKFATSIGVVLIMSYCIRGWGRLQHPQYMRFLRILNDYQADLKPETKKQLQMFDFEFYAWPIDFRWSDVSKNLTPTIPQIYTPPSGYSPVVSIPLQVVGYLAVHSFGIKLIYPGSVRLLQALLASTLSQGRARLIEQFNGQRFKLLARGGNHIDSMFVDRRDLTSNGKILIVCSEGNAGFYENGIMTTPIDAGYSVLGWNHPGFAESTGTPYPDEEQNAVSVVLLFAIHKLNFKPENIILFGWSIGGFATALVAKQHPNIRGIVLDASFDHILPLAQQQMPKAIEPVVNTAIRRYANLNISELLNTYNGPILFIRRTDDEIISTTEFDVSTNRGNYLLTNLLKRRYPIIYDDNQMKLLKEYLARAGSDQDQFIHKYGVDDDLCQSIIQSYVSENSASFPMQIGEDLSVDVKIKVALFLARKHMIDFKASHCAPLLLEYFQRPWDINSDSEFVFT